MYCKDCEYMKTTRRWLIFKTAYCDKYLYTIDDANCECIYETRMKEMHKQKCDTLNKD